MSSNDRGGYDNECSGYLARNERRENDRQPEHRGTCQIGGVEYWISAWVNVGKEGSKLAGKRYFRLAFEPKEQQQRQAPAKRAPRDDGGIAAMDDDVPF